jgi:hypothetical protein
MQRGYPELACVKSCCVFDLPDPFLPEGISDLRAYRRRVGIHILNALASGLASTGYSVKKVKPAIGTEAGFSCLLNEFLDIDTLLEVSKCNDGRVYCVLWARAWRPMLSVLSFARRPPQSECASQLENFLAEIDNQLVERCEAKVVSWVTEKEANNLPERGTTDASSGEQRC